MKWLFSWRPIPTVFVLMVVPMAAYFTYETGMVWHIIYSLLAVLLGLRVIFGGCKWFGRFSLMGYDGQDSLNGCPSAVLLIILTIVAFAISS